MGEETLRNDLLIEWGSTKSPDIYMTENIKKNVDNRPQRWYIKRVIRPSGGIGRHKRLKISRS